MRLSSRVSAAAVALSTFAATASASGGGAVEGGGHGNGRVVSYNTDDVNDPILFFFLVLLLGAAVQLMLSRLPNHWPKPPYTVVLFLFGVLIGALSHQTDFGTLGHATKGMANMDPHLILFAFLPPLLFESAFGMSSHIFVKCLPQALILAVPGVIMAAGMTGVLCRTLFPAYNWSWSLACMFGAMVSATDPVAVVGLLVELNAAKPLSTVIEAESLMNDGSAFVLFLIMKDFAVGIPTSVGDVMDRSFRMAVGGPALGLAFGLGIDNLFLRFCVNDPIIEIALTISGCYLAFWTAESTGFKTSGVLTVVTLGLYMGGIGKRNISPEIHEYMHHVWAFLGHAANTVLFLLSGAFTYDLVSDPTIGGTDWGYLFVLYIIVHVTRGLTIMAVWPAISRLGYGCSVPRGIIMWYGGLRGAVGLILALLVSHEEGIPHEDRIRIQFLTAGLVALTILWNGSTAGILYKKLGLAECTKGHNTTLKLSVDYVETASDKLAGRMKGLEFWPRLVREDIEKEHQTLVQYRPHRVKYDCRPPEEYCTENELLKRTVVDWYNRQPNNAGRIVTKVSHLLRIDDTVFDAKFQHSPDWGGEWPPPVMEHIRASDDARYEEMRFTLDSKVYKTACVTHAENVNSRPHEVYGKQGRVEKKRFKWYPDFSHTLSRHQPSLLQELFGEAKTELDNKPLLHDVREDLRRIIIVSVRERYEEWLAKRIICQETYGILEEATLYVEDEDHLWVAATHDSLWTVRGRYDLKSEFHRILEEVGLVEGGALSFAISDNPLEREPGISDVEHYWRSRTDVAGRVLTQAKHLSSCCIPMDQFTHAYLHHRLRVALQALMFYKAAHEGAWQDIQHLWGALLTGDDEDENTMKEEEDDLHWCYEKADQIVENMTNELPDLKGLVAVIHEDFIHRVMVVQMTESTRHCSHHGLLTEGDAANMEAVIRAKLKPFFSHQAVGKPAQRNKRMVKKSRELEDDDEVNKLPEWERLQEKMEEIGKMSIVNKKSFWEIKFVSQLQGLIKRDRIVEKETQEEEKIHFVSIDGKQRSGSFSIADVTSPFHSIQLSRPRAMHMSMVSQDEFGSDEFEEGDACALTSVYARKFKQRPEAEANLITKRRSNLAPSLVRNLLLAEKQGCTRKGWVRAKRMTRSSEGRFSRAELEVLVECSLVDEEHRYTWYPARFLRRMPNLFYEDRLERSSPHAKARLLTAARQVWFRACVDRVRQQLEFKFPHLVEKHWMNAKQMHNRYVGTPWPWWGSIQQDSVVYTLQRGADGASDWQHEQYGVLLRGTGKRWVDEQVGWKPTLAIRDKNTQVVHTLPEDQVRKQEELVLESHYGEYSLLPSSSHVPFVKGGTEYPTTDHYYQSQKFPDIHDVHREERLEYRRRIIEARTSLLAQQLGQDRKGPQIVPNWDQIRDSVMMDGIRAKFNLQHGLKEQHRQLLSTGYKTLLCVDRNPVMFDRHWSVKEVQGDEPGELKLEGGNAYGKLLMVMREEIRHELVSESLVAATLLILAKSTTRTEPDYRPGEHVRVRQRMYDEWLPGIVITVSAINGRVTVLADGHAEPSLWKYVQPNLQVSTFCRNCKQFQSGLATSEHNCTRCDDPIDFPHVLHFSTYRYQCLMSGAPCEKGTLVDRQGVEYLSIDHYYQATKFPPSDLRDTILKAPTATDALKLGQARGCEPPMRSDWDTVLPADSVPDFYSRVVLAVADKLQVCYSLIVRVFLLMAARLYPPDLHTHLQVRTKVMIDGIRMKFAFCPETGDTGLLFPHHYVLLRTNEEYLLLDDREVLTDTSHTHPHPNLHTSPRNKQTGQHLCRLLGHWTHQHWAQHVRPAADGG